jgi:hypothetical protein
MLGVDIELVDDMVGTSAAALPDAEHPSRRVRPSRSSRSLAPCALGEDQPDAHLPEGKSREAVADQIGPPLSVPHAVLEQLGADGASRSASVVALEPSV